MMRKRYIQDPITHRLVPAEEYQPPEKTRGPMVMEDIKGYVSPLDGTWVGSRSHHRAHMRKHGVIEVGNEKLTRPATRNVEERGYSEKLKRDIARTLSDYGI